MKRETLIAAAVFAAIPLVMLAAAVACTWAIAHGASPAWRWPFRFVCHGIASRCYILWGVPMPICARCTALYIGMFSGLAAFFVFPSVPHRAIRAALFAAAGAMLLDGLTQMVRLRESTNDIRLATGLTVGFTFGMWVLAAIERRDLRKFTAS